MSEPPTEDRLNRYASRRTTSEEENELFREAALDQEAFDAIAQEALFRALLDDPAARPIVLRERAPASVWASWFASLMQPKVAWSAAAVVLAVAIAIGVSLSRPHEPVVILTNITSAGALSDLDRLPDDARTAVETPLGFSRPGDSRASLAAELPASNELRVSAGYASDAYLMIAALPAGQAARILFPNAKSGSGPVKGGTTIKVPAESGKGLDVSQAGAMRIVLLAFGPDTDPMQAIRAGQPLPPVVAAVSRELRPGGQ